MRETLFKAKRIDNGEWVIGHYIPFGLDITIHYDIVFSKGDYIFCSESQQLIEINIKTLCQYTGLNDKNGNKIFENDIVKLNIQLQGYSSGELDDDLSFFGHIIGYIRFIPSKGFCLQSALIYDEILEEKRKHNTKKNIVSYRSEVIGNKFDNPELV